MFKNSVTVVSALISGLMLVSCQSNSAAPEIRKADIIGENPQELVVYNPRLEDGQFIIQVASSGCTRQKDIKIENNDGVLTFSRLRPDLCKTSVHLVRFNYRVEGEVRSITNPVSFRQSLWPVPVRPLKEK